MTAKGPEYRFAGIYLTIDAKGGPDYEHMGRVPDVVFTCGAIADLDTRKLRVHYGGADTCICLAEGDLDAILNACLHDG